MHRAHLELSALVGRIRRRWQALTMLRVSARAGAGASLVLVCALLAQWLVQPEGAMLAILWVTTAALVAGIVGWTATLLRRAPRDLQIARFIEEQCPELEDALVTAIEQRELASDLQSPVPDPHPMAVAVVDDAVRRARELDVDRVISAETLRRAALGAAAASVALLALAGFSAPPASQAARVVGLYLFPHRLGLEVTPGDAKVREGESLRIVARMSGGDTIVPVLRTQDGERLRETKMEKGPDGFTATIDAVEQDFRYLVAAAGTSSREFSVTVIRPPRVERIDLRYEYPSAFGMAPRDEEDGGDIYGPAGTRVQITVHTDKPVRTAALNLTGAPAVPLKKDGDTLRGELTIAEDGSYRVALSDNDGLTNPGETEYFIRTLQDGPPDVRIIRPASDRQVTPLEEVPIEARADDDFGIASLDLVYAIGSGPEKVVPFTRSGSGGSVTGRRTMYLEDLGVKPGDFVAYHARARDTNRGRRSIEARSDIFFLEVTPFEEEFVAAQSQGSGAGGDEEQALEDLIQAQKDIITATWNLDRRGRQAGGRSDDDIRTVARGQRDLRARTAMMYGELQRASDVRRRRLPVGRGGQAANPDVMVEALGRAVTAMGSAQQQLDALKTADALPHEMNALNELLRAQAEVRRREIQRQANGTGGPGGNRQQQDLSSLFDRELAREQQTNYETPPGGERRGEQRPRDESAERIRDLARRQEALNRNEQELAKKRDGMSHEELRRELERLTREQTELRRQAEELARELQQAGRGQGAGGRGQAQAQQGGRGGSSSDEQASRDLQQAAEEMQGAASELRRDNPEQASARGTRAAERLRAGEQRMRGTQPDDRRRALGELQLESRQLAEAQRRLGADAASRGAQGDREDRARRRASEQERLADRTERLEQGIRQLAESGVGDNPREQNALEEAAQEVDRQRFSQRMRHAASAERQGAGRSGQGEAGRGEQPSAAQRSGEEIARGLERLADRLGAASGQGGQNEASQRASEELSRIRRLREELATLDRQLAELRAGSEQKGAQNGRGRGSADNGQGTAGGRGGQNVDATGAWEDARELLNELRQNSELSPPPDADGFNPGRSAPGTEAWKQDFEKWDELKVQVAAALERAERTAAGRLRDQQSRDRLNAGATQAVPEQYRRLVDKYYRALAGGGK